MDASGIFSRHLDGTEDLIEPLRPDVFIFRGMSWSPDRSKLAFTAQYGAQHDVWILTPGETPTSRPFLDSPASEHNPAFSPDGDWLAYVSDESGRFEIYIQQYPQGQKLTVSTEGGNGPVWRLDGEELFYEGQVGGVSKLVAVSVRRDGDSLVLGRPVGLFDLRTPGPTGAFDLYAPTQNAGASFDVLPDGRFVMVREPDPTRTREIVVVQNWTEELKRLVPTN
jgi:WD40 repeat protein